VGRQDACPHGGEEEDVDELRVELRAASVEQDLSRFLDRAAVAVLPTMGDGVEGISDGDDTGGERYALALELTRIAGAVPALVMSEDALLEIGIETGEWLEHVRAATRVRGDGASFGGGEVLNVVDDVEERLMDLADVVKERDAQDAASSAPGKPCFLGEDEGILRDAADVDAGVRIIGIDGAEERFEGGSGHAFGGLTFPKLAPEEDAAEDGGATCRDGSLSESHRAG